MRGRAYRGFRFDRRLLARYCPLDRPVAVEFTNDLGNCWGEADRVRVLHRSKFASAARTRTRYLIRLLPSLGADLGRDTFAHEWGHCRAWDLSRIDHGAKWGICYARCYRVLIDGWRPKRHAARKKGGRRG